MDKRLVGVAIASLLAAGCSANGSQSTAQPAGLPVTPHVLQNGGKPRDFTQFWPQLYSDLYGGIVAGHDSAIWFLDTGGPGLVRTSMGGVTTEVPLPSDQPYELWPVAIGLAFHGYYVLDCNRPYGAVEHVDESGKGPAYELPAEDMNGPCSPESMAVGEDDNAWYAGYADVDRVTASGTITQFAYPGGPDPQASIVKGPRGLLWFSDSTTGSIDSIDPKTGDITSYAFGGSAYALLAPPDGNIWFVCSNATSCPQNTIAKMTPDGIFTYYSTPAVASGITAGAVGPGKTIYFATNHALYQPELLRVDESSGAMTQIQSPYGLDIITAMTTGPDKNVWMTAFPDDGHVDVYITHIMDVSPSSLVLTGPGQAESVIDIEHGNPTLTAYSSNPGIATVKPGKLAQSFVITGQSVGQCTVTIGDQYANFFNVPVTVQ